MPRAVWTFRAHLGWRVWRETACVSVEPELINGVGTIPSDVWHKHKTVGRVSLHTVRPTRCTAPFDRRTTGDTGGIDGMHRRPAGLVVSRKHKAPAAIC